jgi:uncharacterized protein (DUF4213/DUF364 family)
VRSLFYIQGSRPLPEIGVRDVGRLDQKTALELAEYARSDSLMEASSGMATINSLIEVDDSKCVEKNAFEILLEKGEGKNVAMVGHFSWIPRLKDKTLWVLEQRIRDRDLPAQEAGRVLPQCDVVGITGTSFVNHTLEGLLTLCKKAYIVVIDPTPPPLFDSLRPRHRCRLRDQGDRSGKCHSFHQPRRAGDLIIRTIGLIRVKAKIGLRNLAYNLDQF